jgi:DNA-directed RNA polymerase sigma subunit (sigma70/sigma32)
MYLERVDWTEEEGREPTVRMRGKLYSLPVLEEIPDLERLPWVLSDGGRNAKEMNEAIDRNCSRRPLRLLPMVLSSPYYVSDRNRKMIHLRFDEDKTYREIGEEVGLSAGYARQVVRQTLSRVRKTLREMCSGEDYI